MLHKSRGIYQKYNAPLGIGWMVEPHSHYGPNPEGYEYALWGTYLRADRNGVGIDRTGNGTGYVLQYPEEWQKIYGDKTACPDELKLFFHYLRYEETLSDGRTLIQRIYDDHFEGYAEVEQMAETLRQLPLPSPDREVADERMERQLINARNWCDIVNNYFCRLSGVEDAKGRKIYH
jgi:alpha-glucuronidase